MSHIHFPVVPGKTSALLPLLLAAILCLAAAPAARSGSGEERSDRPERSDKEAIAELIYCYARGTDAIGDSTTNADPLATGAAIYRGCFTPNAMFRAWFPQQKFDRQAFPNPDAFPESAPAPFLGPYAWAVFVNSVFRGNGYTFTQHILSNVNVTVNGDTGRLTAYLNASHVISGTAVGGPSRCVAVANGTYSGYARKIRGKWLLTRLDLTLITFNAVFQAGDGC